MELEVGGGSNRRDSWAGLTLGAVLGTDTRPDSIAQVSRTLLDIIRDEEPNSGAYKNLVTHHNNKKNWKSFKDRLRLKKTGDGWTSSVISSPTSSSGSPTLQQNGRSFLSRRNSTLTNRTIVPSAGGSDVDVTRSEDVVCDLATRTCRPQITRRLSTQVSSFTSESFRSPVTPESSETLVVETVPVQDLRSHMLSSNSSRLLGQSEEPAAAPSIRLSAALAAEREQIQRVVLSTENETRSNAVEATGVEEENGITETAQQPVRMSLMDLLEETDRQMGWTSYSAGDVEDEEELKHNDVEHDKQGAGGSGLTERNCCVCMVRHKGAAFIPCGHTFCRLCSRELWVNRGNCPLCNGYILEILDIF